MRSWIDRNNVQAIYLDYWLALEDPKAYALLQGEVGKLFTVAFQVSAPDVGRARILTAQFGKPVPDTFTVLRVDGPR